MLMLRGEVNGCPVTIIDLNREPEECGICGALGFHQHFVWWYEGPCCSLDPDRAGCTVCRSCHDQWAIWDEEVAIPIAERYGTDLVPPFRRLKK